MKTDTLLMLVALAAGGWVAYQILLRLNPAGLANGKQDAREPMFRTALNPWTQTVTSGGGINEFGIYESGLLNRQLAQGWGFGD